MKKHIVIVEIVSTGFNYVEDALMRGYQPVVVECTYPGTEEDRAPFLVSREIARGKLPKGIPYIEETSDYAALLEKVRAYDPVLVVPGQDFAVELATHLAYDLGLPGNPWSIIGKMTRKNEMHQALADHGVRYIRGKLIHNEGEAIAFYKELGTTHVVVKRARGACTQGMHFCEGYDEMVTAVRTELALSASDEHVGDILMQERIIGKEYIVNTVSCAGKHRLVSMCFYDKLHMNGSNIYNYMETVTRLDVGESAIVRYAYDVLDAIGIQYGPVHGEFMVDEKGPVLIEINCRPMGAGQTRQFLEKIYGQHETDSALDSYLDPVKFEQERRKPYRPPRKGIIKWFILPNDVTLESAPVLQLVRQLPSYCYSVFERLGREPFLTRTRDLETTGGAVYLVHDDERQVKEDCAFLHMLEMQYPEILFHQITIESPVKTVSRIPLEELMQEAGCHGATLVFSDNTETEVPGAVVVDSEGLSSAYDCYNNVIIDLSRPETFADTESLAQQIFVLLGKVCEGGRVLVPESTYCHLPYGAIGMEALLRTRGMCIEAPLAGKGRLLIASV
ncbi:MAG: ATP-grasp domain-containing protein [Prevotella sp.]|nr:ATP-grasp domain-containing protein [Prevotella sp.]